ELGRCLCRESDPVFGSDALPEGPRRRHSFLVRAGRIGSKEGNAVGVAEITSTCVGDDTGREVLLTGGRDRPGPRIGTGEPSAASVYQPERASGNCYADSI